MFPEEHNMLPHEVEAYIDPLILEEINSFLIEVLE